MKTDELSIGDWLQDNYCYAHNVKIAAISKRSIREEKFEVWRPFKFLTPIQITPEILEKNGFTKSNVFVEWKYEEEGIYILWKPFPFLKIETENVQLNLSGCEYVHELQHALRLCGIEKDIIV